MIAGAVPVKRPNLPRTTRGRILATLREAGRPLSRHRDLVARSRDDRAQRMSR